MNMLDKLKGIMGAPTDEDEEYEDEEYEQDTQEEYAEEEQHRNSTNNHNSHYEQTNEAANRPGKVVNMASSAPLQVVLVKPERFEDASAIADHLNAKRTVVLNLEGTSKEVSRRLVDFLSGVAYANHGQMKRVANSTFIITPFNVDIMGDLLDELESNGVFF